MNKLIALKPYVLGALFALALYTVGFFTMHRNGFVKFMQDPAFFDNVSIERNYKLMNK